MCIQKNASKTWEGVGMLINDFSPGLVNVGSGHVKAAPRLLLQNRQNKITSAIAALDL